ncbi:MAG: cell division protein FtsA, partial [Alistipes sp.]|nr:cell division protein FtsA [Alistipes sp.]
MERKNYIIAIDLGSSNVTVAVGEQNAEGLLDVVCAVRKPAEGVNAGKIENIELVGNAIREAVSEVEKRLGISISEAYAGISGDFVRCARHTDHVFVSDPQNGVSQKDVAGLFDRMRNVQAPDDETIMERVPQNYVVDDAQEVRNPVGSFGRKLSSTFNFILCHKTPIQRLDMALKRLGIRILGVLPDALAVPEAVLSPDEKEEGAAVVDIGGGVTDVTVYYRNVVRYVASIPMGASAFNRDIRTMSIPEKHVEQLKLQCGSAVADLEPDDKCVRVPGRIAREEKVVLHRNLATVIEARATDIAEFVVQEIKDSGYFGKLAFGIVLTGGSANLRNLDELFRRVTGMEVRVAVPETGLSEAAKGRVKDPAYATVTGILLRGAELGASSVLVDLPAPAPTTAPAPAAAGRPADVSGAETAVRRPEPRSEVPPRPQPRPWTQPQPQPRPWNQPPAQPQPPVTGEPQQEAG